MFTEPSFQRAPFRESDPNCPVARSGSLDFSIRHHENSLRAKIGLRSIYCRSETLCDMQVEPTLPASSTCIDHLRLSPNLSKVDISSLVASDSNPMTEQRRHEERAELAMKALVGRRRLKIVKLNHQP